MNNAIELLNGNSGRLVAVQLAKMLERHFGVSIEEPPGTIEGFEKLLLPVINDYLNHNFEGFLSLLYRLDVQENKFKECLNSPPGEIARNTCHIILERELIKIKYRMRYSSN